MAESGRVLALRGVDAHAGAERRDRLLRRFQRIRGRTTGLVASLGAEDQIVQSMPAASPAKWHLAHTTWFLEHHVLLRHAAGYAGFDDGYAHLFAGHGRPGGLPRERRGLTSRPVLAEVARYRDHVNAAVLGLLRRAPAALLDVVEPVLELALAHELLHQESLLTDVKHLFWSLPGQPAYRTPQPVAVGHAPPQRWSAGPAGLVELGCEAAVFDHERPRHRAWLDPFRLAGRPVSCGEYLAFIEDGGYAEPRLWLAEGWRRVEAEGWRAPFYWQHRDDQWQIFTLQGPRPLVAAEPVCHVSFYEAEAFARWAGRRLPTEAEWEAVAALLPVEGNLLQNDRFHPAAAAGAEPGPWQMFGDVWEWTASAFAPYPGFRRHLAGAEDWSGHFLSGAVVVRGGSCLTPAELARPALRHALPPASRWHMTGIRLAADG